MMLEAYYNFGWLGLIIIPGLMGFTCRAISRRIAAGSNFWTLQGIFIFVGAASFRCLGDIIALVMFQSLVVAALIASCRLFYTPSRLVSGLAEREFPRGASPIPQGSRPA
jgi:hypothetical protein